MNLFKKSVTITVFLLLLLALAPTALGFDAPSFPSCINPQGTIRAQYYSGTHGIVGDSRTFNGSDTVYTLSNNNVYQCFCPTDGSGIQTNWLRANTFTQSDIQNYKNSGWTYIPDGSAWGLDGIPYMAKNYNYTCAGGIGGGELGGQVLGLASTGNLVFIAEVFSIGIFSLLLSFYLKKITRKNS
jgi:hypothetical protein